MLEMVFLVSSYLKTVGVKLEAEFRNMGAWFSGLLWRIIMIRAPGGANKQADKK